MPPETKKKERAFPVEACPPGGRTFGFMAAENQKKKKQLVKGFPSIKLTFSMNEQRWQNRINLLGWPPKITGWIDIFDLSKGLYLFIFFTIHEIFLKFFSGCCYTLYCYIVMYCSPQSLIAICTSAHAPIKGTATPILHVCHPISWKQCGVFCSN